MSSDDESEYSKEKLQEIDNNYATPLAGTYLNLTHEPARIECPSCGLKELTEVHLEPTPWAEVTNKVCMFFFIILCCGCCFNYSHLAKKEDANHYCKNCSCFLGRAKRMSPMKHYKGVRLANKYDK